MAATFPFDEAPAAADASAALSARVETRLVRVWRARPRAVSRIPPTGTRRHGREMAVRWFLRIVVVLFRVRADGTGFERLTQPDGYRYGVAFSPGGDDLISPGRRSVVVATEFRPAGAGDTMGGALARDRARF